MNNNPQNARQLTHSNTLAHTHLVTGSASLLFQKQQQQQEEPWTGLYKHWASEIEKQPKTDIKFKWEKFVQK